MHFLKPGLGGHAPEHVSVLRENQPGSKRRKTKVNFIYWRRESETGECRGLLSCLPCPRCVGIGPGLLPWLCGAPQAPRSAQLPWPSPAVLPWLCAGSSGARVCPHCVGIGPVLLPWLCGAPQAPGSAQLPWPSPALTGPLPPLWNALTFLPQSV